MITRVGQPERSTQNRVVQLFSQSLGYTYLGNWEDRPNNSNIEEQLLTEYLRNRGYSDSLISRALTKLSNIANNDNDKLPLRNKNVYTALRFGVNDKENAGDNEETVHLIDWKHPENNHFAVAEEVTYQGHREKRPDIVLYVNGIALAVLELKRSTVSVGEGIRQSITNQGEEWIERFFSTIQFVFAGNDSEGLRYGTIGTGEKYFLKWKEGDTDEGMLQIDKYLTKMCTKERFLEIIHDFVIFDGGTKKLPRPHQYFGIKAAQGHVQRKESGIIWHTQGSGKSLVMVTLAKWILENDSNARVLIVTDRDELDKQIERVFDDAGEQARRVRSGKDLMRQLSHATPRILCTLVHKFGVRDGENVDEFLKELNENPANVVGDLFVFVDECHRTQSGDLHKVMKATLKGATFIGFTGTPLLKKDKQTSLEVFGKYIHTYKFNEAVEDEVVLDLVYEARDIDQKISSPERIDTWFDSKTRGLNDFQRSELKKKWGTMQTVLSSRSRMERVVQDIILDFATKPRLRDDQGNAILVAGSILEASKYFDLFQRTELRDKCALITSYAPSHRDIVTEDTGANTETDKQYIYNLYTNLVTTGDTEKYEDKAKKQFRDEPANMKLLIVVDKLLTGFDAPPCTYLYIDKSMQDHGLFQAICRVNRLDGDDKQFGYIVDYKDLFRKVENAVSVYTSELEYDSFEKEDVDVMLKDRLQSARERLEEAREAIAMLCEPVPMPRGTLEYQRYFCGNVENADDLKATEFRRVSLYKHTLALVRAYANISDEMEAAGYTAQEIAAIDSQLKFYIKLRDEIRIASNEVLDMKAYEADMRFLIDNYIQADDPRRISDFGDVPLMDIIMNAGMANAIESLPQGIRQSKEAVAETIENNVRSKIIKDQLIDPVFFGEMSTLLDEIIKERRAKAINYEQYLAKIGGLVETVQNGGMEKLPPSITTGAQRALYNNLGKDDALALRIDEAIRVTKKADWRGNPAREQEIKHAMFTILNSEDEVERLFPIIRQQAEY